VGLVTVPTVSADDIPENAILLDVREDDEWAAGHIDGAVHVPMMRLPNQLAYEPGELTPAKPIVVVCAHGGRSAQVTHWLSANGYNATNLAGGMHAWAQAGRPMVSESGGEPQVL
jgi:rhodanese-related sulfurtransferase